MYTKSSGATHCGKILWPGPYRRPFVLISSFARHSFGLGSSTAGRMAGSPLG